MSTPPSTPPSAPTNAWDFAIDFGRALVAIGALVVLTIFLAGHYSNVKDTTSVLGIVVPVLAAALGATIGFVGGEEKGKAGKEEAVKGGRKQLAQQLRPLVEDAESTVGSRIIEPLKTHLRSPEGSDSFVLELGQGAEEPLSFAGADFDRGQDRLARARAILDSVDGE